MQYRLIVSDIDGTLLPIGQKEFSSETCAIAQKCRNAGCLFTLSTGRTFPNALPIAEKLGITGPLITANGGIVIDTTGKVIASFPFEESGSLFLCNDLLSRAGECNCYSPDGFFKLDRSGVVSHKEITIGRNVFIDSLNEPELFYSHCRSRACKIEAYTHTNDTGLMRRLIQEYNSMGFQASQAFPDDIEIMPPHRGKGYALSYLAEYLHIGLSETAAFGDNMNDVDMLSCAGCAVAVGNAVEALKRVADEIAPAADQNGVACAIDKMLEGKL